mmetsp:Transcript_7846/g.23695  ORF Transcript_7846/g.23695 Transcript_7846/m.23695 type:complete len:315 (-) Transcript_7846:152-1096(-)|eukprot:CAMPEP_0198726568 /NCGR_PEP_ID=MMETSP1475-20131203/3580_1 /TAXON_ID= ORGANISM="Unidentified sp., Strain CCMP1999" /NCGR_SAMPLE_ID=MMETSP1475 /ASSEMBLY_ACC=CAM_ASM_001111 /LENGTH=314 /DNA_ID=CAMNT_0044488503 /DNA_START=61 /DNA_END=1005 /DNA_ORIENTATION=-
MGIQPTDRRPLGQTGYEVSPIGYGASPLGGVFGDIKEQDGIDAVHEAFRRGVNLFDTSPFYGVTKSETVLGKALADLPRKDIVVATKCGRYGEDQFDFSAERVTASIDESLKRLQLEYVDILYCHDVEFGDLDQVANETLPALQKLKESGKVRAIGFTGLPLKIFQYITDHSKVHPDVVLSYCHNCLNDTSLQDIVPYLESKNVGIVNASALCMGLLTKSGGPEWHPAPQELKDAAKKAYELCESRGKDLPKLALQYSLSYDRVSSTLVGMETVDKVKTCIEAASEPIDEDLLKDVLEVLEPVHNMTWPSGKDA